MYKRNQKTWYKHFDFMLLDCLCMEISFLLAYIFRYRVEHISALIDNMATSEHYSRLMLYIVILQIVLIIFAEPYSGVLNRNTAEECKRVLLYNVYILIGIVLIMFVAHSSVLYSRIVIFVFPLIDSVLMIVSRFFYKRFLRKKINKEENQDCMLLVAPYSQIESILNDFYNNRVSVLRIVAIAITDEEGYSGQDTFNGIPIISVTEDMYEFARTNVVDEVLLCMEGNAVKKTVETFLEMGITVHVSVQSLVHIPKATMNTVNGISVITASVNIVTSRQLLIKRSIDICAGLIGSIITVIITIFVAPMIWFADPGPIFFRQERVGKNGRVFKIWKFRTMYKDAEVRKGELMSQNKMHGLMFKMDDDPRVIGFGKKFSVGAFLRRTSIDEFPQFFNILEGSMSLVGTRPPTVKEVEQYDLHHKGRLATKPGLTGMWQVSGRSEITDFEEVVRLDKYYIDNFRLKLDLEIILKTIKVVLGKKGSM